MKRPLRLLGRDLQESVFPAPLLKGVIPNGDAQIKRKDSGYF
jgi:hypothetical protein